MKKEIITGGKKSYQMENRFTTNEQKVLEIFFHYPTRLFSVREIARLEKVTHPTVSSCLHKLKAKGLAEVDNVHYKGVLFWKAKTDSTEYKVQKKLFNLRQLYSSGIIEKIAEETAPNAIVVFGSYSKGEDVEGSDIDLFVLSKEKEINTATYEKKLHRKINCTYESSIKALNKEFLNNVINGVIMYGYLEVLK